MIASLKDSDGKIIGYMEWQVVDERGKWKNGGEYLYIEDVWLHPSERRKSLFKLIQLVVDHYFAFNCKWSYWERRKYGKISKTYPIALWASKGVRDEKQTRTSRAGSLQTSAGYQPSQYSL